MCCRPQWRRKCLRWGWWGTHGAIHQWHSPSQPSQSVPKWLFRREHATFFRGRTSWIQPYCGFSLLWVQDQQHFNSGIRWRNLDFLKSEASPRTPGLMHRQSINIWVPFRVSPHMGIAMGLVLHVYGILPFRCWSFLYSDLRLYKLLVMQDVDTIREIYAFANRMCACGWVKTAVIFRKSSW